MENKKKLIALVIGIILIILVGGLVFYLTSHLTETRYDYNGRSGSHF